MRNGTVSNCPPGGNVCIVTYMPSLMELGIITAVGAPARIVRVDASQILWLWHDRID